MEYVTEVCSTTKYEPISYEEAIGLEGYRHAAHCCIYCLTPAIVMKRYPAKASILMQNRFDGMIGFPGGLIDKEKSVVVGMNRELEEEINLDRSKFSVDENDHVASHRSEKGKVCYHLYKKLVSIEDFTSIERRILDAEEYGNETMGLLRVPIYTEEDGYGGFPSFLCNNFAGNSRTQLLLFLANSQLLTHSEISQAIHAFRDAMKNNVPQ